jgi:hypothetical protein
MVSKGFDYIEMRRSKQGEADSEFRDGARRAQRSGEMILKVIFEQQSL